MTDLSLQKTEAESEPEFYIGDYKYHIKYLNKEFKDGLKNELFRSIKDEGLYRRHMW